MRIAIGALARHAGATVETIRYYERLGLWPAPPRTAAGYRLYGTDHVQRLAFIRRARGLGFALREVRTLLRVADERTRPCAEARAVAEERLAHVRDEIAGLRAMEKILEATIARCAGGKDADCVLLDATGPRGRRGRERIAGPTGPAPGLPSR